MSQSDARADEELMSKLVRIASVRTDYGVAEIPAGAEWTGGWTLSGLPIAYEDGRKDVVRWQDEPKPPRWEWFVTVS